MLKGSRKIGLRQNSYKYGPSIYREFFVEDFGEPFNIEAIFKYQRCHSAAPIVAVYFADLFLHQDHVTAIEPTSRLPCSGRCPYGAVEPH